MAGARIEIDHYHAELEFNLVVNGTGSYTQDAQTYLLKPGTLIWQVPGQRHRLARSPRLEMWVVSVQPEHLDRPKLAELARQPSRLLPGHELVDLDRLLSQVAQDSDDPAVYNAGITYVLLRAWRASQDRPPAHLKPMHPAVGRALLLLRQSGAGLSLSELASRTGAAAPYLSRLLVEHTGRSFVDWRNRIRLDRFMDGYRPGANLLDAALEAGFGSYARFNHIFNEMIGCSPSEWVNRADKQTDASPATYGMPSTHLLSTRQRWAGLVPVVDASIRAAVGSGFVSRMLAAAPEAAADVDTSRLAQLDASLPPDERQRLITSLRSKDRAIADEFARLMDAHDFAGTYAGVLTVFDRSPANLYDAVTALVAVVWAEVNPGSDPETGQLAALARQVRVALGGSPAGLPDRRAAQDAHTALLCLFVVHYHALQAARASGDPRAMEELGRLARRCGREAFDGDFAALDLVPGRGLVRIEAP